MGSCSSKSRTRVLKVNIVQPTNPLDVPVGENIEGRSGTYDQGAEQEPFGRSITKDNLSKVTGRGGCKPKPKDQDLQLLDEILAESEDCLSWQDPTSEVRTSVSRSHNANSSPDPKLGPERKLQKPSELQPSSSGLEESQCRHHPVKENCNKTVEMAKGPLDFENNNLPYKPPSLCTDPIEKTIVIRYDDSEEALMDSIEEEYSQQDVQPHCSGDK
ncbi:uncharacterized protein LOC128484434 [Spea bombifrons]|uniref:uncharacterized protein LOC128484434 n=1 Tax=Spea bombifrons TaxID=233779 RepID=UPI00234940AC|nr:uncharacterized protein LOC128484434 [Spea bombifrons]XP_053316786.1 uncharacterized protein LOC128484434 [Spea bombifrons]